MRLLCYKLLLLTLCFTASTSMMMRNNALISRMISKFQKDSVPVQSKPTALQNPKDVLTLMQNVLCKNFPTIPCQMIIEDETLRTLIERSIQQLKYKKLTMQNTTPPPAYHLTLFPTINSEDLSNFLQVSDTGYYSQSKQEKTRSRRHKKRLEKELKKNGNKKKNNQRSSPYQGHKNIRKFYPHKIKYKDKSENNPKENNNFRDYSDEKFSMSVENLLANERNGMKRFDSNFRQAPENLPVWRIDYTKHGEPSVNMFDYESDRLKEKLVKTGPNVIVNEGTLEQAPRKDVMHPDVYIKRNYIRRNALDVDSAGID